jgi:hypothetical protein
VVAILVGASVMLTAGPALAQYFWVDFDTPPHQVGQPPATGYGPPPRQTVSSIPFGTPTVVSTFGLLTDQPCEFNSFDAEGDQIKLDVSDLPQTDGYGLVCDILIADLATGGDFAILFDTPQVRTIRFSSTGDVNVYVPGIFSGSIGTFAMGEVLHVEVSLELVSDLWTILVGPSIYYAGAFGGATELRDIRFSTPVTPNPPGASAGIDDILVWDEPLSTAVEPGSWGRIKAVYRQAP